MRVHLNGCFIASSFVLASCLGSASGHAAELRDYCPDRPGIAAPPCVIDQGHVSVEAALVDWTREHDSSSRTDTLATMDLLVRYGLDGVNEAQIEWLGLAHVRSRDFATGQVGKVTHAGDLILRVRHNLAHPDGEGTSIAVAPYLSLPTGRTPVGAGDWGAGVDVPLSISLGGHFALTSSPEIAAAVDADGRGRHLAYGSTLGLAADISDALSSTVELAAYRDRDPSGHSTEAMLGLSFSYKANKNLHFDTGSTFGLNHQTADVELYLGVSRRF